MEGGRGTEVDEEEEEEELSELLPHKQMKELEEQNKFIRTLYKELQQEQDQDHHHLQKQQQHRHQWQELQHQQEQQQQQQELQEQGVEWQEQEQLQEDQEDQERQEQIEQQQEKERLHQQLQIQQQNQVQKQGQEQKQQLQEALPWKQQLQQYKWEHWQEEEVEEEPEDPLEVPQPQGEGDLYLDSDPLALPPGLVFGGRRIIKAEEVEEEEEEEVDEEMKGLIPPKEKTREVEAQNRIIFSLYEDSLQTSEHSGSHTLRTFPYPSTRATTATFPSSSTPSLAPEYAGGGAAMGAVVKGILAQETSHHKALQLNLALQQAFRATIAKLELALKKNQKTQAEAAKGLDVTWTPEGTSPSPGVKRRTRGEDGQRQHLAYSRLSVPYFKDSSGMSAPMNEDGKKKVNAGYLDLYTIKSRFWITREQVKLREMVEKAWKEQCIKKVKQDVKDLKRKIRAVLSREELDQKLLAVTQEKLREEEKELAVLEVTKPEDLALPPRHTPYDWELISAQGFDGQRTAVECQLMWDNLLHPDINREAFSEEEDLIIQGQVRWDKTYKHNNWEAIAKWLGNNRTGYLVMQRWVNFLEPTLHPVQWTIRDTKQLLDSVNLLRRGEHIPWSQVHQRLPGYTRAQIHTRWKLINPERNSRRFSLEEDKVFIKGIYLFGLNFTSIAGFLPGRNYTQVREKFRRSVLPSLTTRRYTRKEDKTLLVRGGESNGYSSKLIWHLPKHLLGENRCRFVTLQLWQSLMGEDQGEVNPPPLFPLTTTTDEDEITDIRSFLLQESIQESIKLKDALKKSRGEIEMEPILQEVKEAHAEMEKEAAAQVAERMQKLINLRGNFKGTTYKSTEISIIASLYDKFFSPARPFEIDVPPSDKVLKSLKVLAETMLFKAQPTREEAKEEEEKEEEEEDEEGKREKRERGKRKKRKWEESEEEEEEEEVEEKEGWKKQPILNELDEYLCEEFMEMWKGEEQKKKRVRAKEQADEGDTSRSRGVDGDEGGGVDVIPITPPNLTTVGALHSFFIHRPVLTEMATGNFIFQRYSVKKLCKMSRWQIRKRVAQDGTVRKQAEDYDEEDDDEDEEETSRMARNTPSITKIIPHPAPSSPSPLPPIATPQPSNRVPSEERSASSDSEGEGAVTGGRETADSEEMGDDSSGANAVDASPDAPGVDVPYKIHITSTKQKARKRRKSYKAVKEEKLTTYTKVKWPKVWLKGGVSGEGSHTQPATNTTTTTSITTTSTTTIAATPTSTTTIAATPTTSTHTTIAATPTTPTRTITIIPSLPEQDEALEEASTSACTFSGDVPGESTEQKAEKDKADKLLLHRMLSLFAWPSLLTTSKPMQWQVQAVDKKPTARAKRIGEWKEAQGMEGGTWRTAKSRKVKSTPKWPNLDVEDLTKRVEELKKTKSEHLAKMNDLRMQWRASRKKDKNAPPPQEKKGKKRKQTEDPEQDTMQPTPPPPQDTDDKVEEEQDTTQPPSPDKEEMQPTPPQEEEEAEAGSSSPMPDIRKLTIGIARNVRSMKSLSRSLRMKKVWEGRQQGIYSHRKPKTRKVAEYRPRGSRTRGTIPPDSPPLPYIP